MSIIIRLQNLPWAATCMDIRRYFWGLSIPEGGVHIVGGEMGDAFIGFSTDEDARQAMSRDGGKILEMQIRLLLSSHAEMMRVIEKARQQNMALQSQVMPQPSMMPVTQSMPQMMPVTQPQAMSVAHQQSMPVSQPPAMSMSHQQTMPVTHQQAMSVPHQQAMSVSHQQGMPVTQPQMMSMTQQHQSLPQVVQQQQPPDASDPSDRGRRGRSPSPSRRQRDRSPGRSSDRSRRSSSKRDRSRSPPRGSRASSSDYRRSDRSGKRDDRGYDDRSYRDDRYRKYPDGSRDRRYYDNQASDSPSYGSYDRSKSASNSYSSNDKGSASQQMSSFPVGSNNNYSGSSGGNSSYDHSAGASNSGKPAGEEFPKRRRSRFDPEPSTTSSDIPFFDAEQKNKLAEALRALPNLPLGNVKQSGQEYSSSTNTTWPQQNLNQDSRPQNNWPKLEKPRPNQGVVPMDLENSPTSSPPDTSSKIIVSPPYNAQRDSSSFMPGSSDMSSRHHPSPLDQKDRFMNKPQQQQQQWSAPSPSTLTVEVRGLPPDVKVNEILDLFHSAPLAPANVFILKNQRGDADKALVQFQKLSDAQTALSRQPCYIRNYCCEVVSCPDALFKAAITNATPLIPAFKQRPKEEDWCIQMSGFSFPCTEADISRILGGLRIVDLAIDVEKGCAFIQLSSDQDFRCALSMSGKMFGQGYITIAVSSKEFLNAARGSSEQRRTTNSFASPSSGRRPFNENPNGAMHEKASSVSAPHSRPQHYAVQLRQLAKHVTDLAINEFFKEIGINVKAIHILLSSDKIPTGEGFIEVATKNEMDLALTKHNTMFLGRPILVTPIPFQEMNLILNPPGLLPTPDDELPHRGPERPFNKPEFEAPPNGRPPRKEFFDGPGHPPPRGERPFYPDRPRPDYRGERPFFPRQRGERSRMDGPPMRGPRPPMRPPFGRMRGPFQQRPRGPPWDPSRAREQGEIGAPGCVVNIDNLHYDAGFEEILEFFKGYGILRDNIIRKYDERKQPTSKARVAFHAPWDAERAVRELDGQKIKGRPLKLSLL